MSFKSGPDAAGQLKAFRRAARGAHVQTFDSSALAGEEHVLRSLKQSVELERAGGMLADKVEVDFLIRVAGTKQISEALKAAGSRPLGDSVLVVFGTREYVRRGIRSVSRLATLEPFGLSRRGARAFARVSKLELSSVLGEGDPVSRLLAEKAALLRR
jgi:tRNA threonylcarbamoyladenosine modification (KEOPS) complex Cgi121 subunit